MLAFNKILTLYPEVNLRTDGPTQLKSHFVYEYVSFVHFFNSFTTRSLHENIPFIFLNKLEVLLLYYSIFVISVAYCHCIVT
jgi:hypothetical protein